MIEKNDLDAIIISLPNFLTKDCCVLSSERGFNILVEKPMGRTLEEGKQIANHIKKSGVNLMVAMCHRYIPSCRDLKKAIDD